MTRLVTVVVTLAVPDEADPEDAAALVEDAATSTALEVVTAVGIEGHLSLPGGLVHHHRDEIHPHHDARDHGVGEPWLVESLHSGGAVLRDLGGNLIRAPLTALAPDHLDRTPVR